ncbi:MAG TPA: hypothetical protein VFZ95_10405 [Steroidobacteraceae bacterium]
MSQPVTERAPELGHRARSIATIFWSAFLAAALATMLCFAFIDPEALRDGNPPGWWSSRLHVYAVGFFFFWLIGMVSAALCWQLSRGVR